MNTRTDVQIKQFDRPTWAALRSYALLHQEPLRDVLQRMIREWLAVQKADEKEHE